jgi:hypothetical protein
MQIWSPAANNQRVALPHECSLFLYRAPAALPSSPRADDRNLRLVDLAEALVAASPSFYVQQLLAATICLGMIDDTAPLLQRLLDGSHSVVAGRLAGAFRALGRDDFAQSIMGSMRGAGYTVQELSPFELPPAPLPGGRPESPYVQRMRRTWADMRDAVIAAFPQPPPVSSAVKATLQDVEERYVADAYHSLSIEGYHVTADLIEQVRNGPWNPDAGDRSQRDAMAAKGYFEAHRAVKAFIAESIRRRVVAGIRGVRDALGAWYVALFSPGVQAGLLKPSDLAGWRNEQVFIRGALHVPLSTQAVRDCMPVLFELIENEPHPAVRAVLGHFFLVYIHPYMDGNGRLARFHMNAMFVSGGYVWTIVPVQQRRAYMDALERASSYDEIEPFARFIGQLTREQSAHALPRPE